MVCILLPPKVRMKNLMQKYQYIVVSSFEINDIVVCVFIMNSFMVHITTILYTLGMTINILNMSSAHTNVAHAIVFLMPTHFSHTWGQALS